VWWNPRFPGSQFPRFPSSQVPRFSGIQYQKQPLGPHTGPKLPLEPAKKVGSDPDPVGPLLCWYVGRDGRVVGW
jgi:hypothetical protein